MPVKSGGVHACGNTAACLSWLGISIFERDCLSRFTLEVIAPHIEDQLASALEAMAIIHGGAVVESSEVSTRSYQRQYVNIFDCEHSLEQEVQWLRNKFPDTRFTLKEFM